METTDELSSLLKDARTEVRKGLLGTAAWIAAPLIPVVAAAAGIESVAGDTGFATYAGVALGAIFALGLRKIGYFEDIGDGIEKIRHYSNKSERLKCELDR